MADLKHDSVEKAEAVNIENGNQAHSASVEDAKLATAKEQSMTLMEGIKRYPKAIAWSVFFSSAIIMEGYDVVLMPNFFASPAFTKQFGELQPDGKYIIPASWQSGLTNAMSCGQILGLFCAGLIVDRIGYRKTMMGALSMCACIVFILFFAKSKPQLIAGEFLLGIPLGAFQTVTVTYASEVCPVVLRAYLTTYVNMCWVIGQLLSTAVLRGLHSLTTEWGWRIAYALQWVWPVPLIIGAALAPESPWWLVRVGRKEDAKVSLRRITSEDEGEDTVEETVAMMIHTNEREKKVEQGTSYADCFKGVNLRRTEIVVFTWACQNLCGAGLMNYSTYFYEQAGLDGENAFNMTLGQYGLGLVGTVLSWVLMTHFGRRTLYVGGLAILCILLFCVGFISLAGEANTGASWAAGSMLLVFTFVFDMSVGPVCYSLVSELSSTRLRTKTVVIARSLYNCVAIMNNTIIPYMLNPTAWHWAGKAGFFWGGACAICVTWTFFRLPEPKGRTYGELDALFTMGVPARKFKSTVVDPFESTSNHNSANNSDDDESLKH